MPYYNIALHLNDINPFRRENNVNLCVSKYTITQNRLQSYKKMCN